MGVLVSRLKDSMKHHPYLIGTVLVGVIVGTVCFAVTDWLQFGQGVAVVVAAIGSVIAAMKSQRAVTVGEKSVEVAQKSVEVTEGGNEAAAAAAKIIADKAIAIEILVNGKTENLLKELAAAKREIEHLKTEVAELKKRGEVPRPEQWEWLWAFEACGVKAYFWTPDDVETIREILR